MDRRSMKWDLDFLSYDGESLGVDSQKYLRLRQTRKKYLHTCTWSQSQVDPKRHLEQRGVISENPGPGIIHQISQTNRKALEC